MYNSLTGKLESVKWFRNTCIIKVHQILLTSASYKCTGAYHRKGLAEYFINMFEVDTTATIDWFK